MEGGLWRWMGLLGLPVFIGLVYAASADRRGVRWRQALWGMGLQAALALLVFKVEVVGAGLRGIAEGVQWVMSFADRGAEKVFGKLAGGDMEVVLQQPGGAAGPVAAVTRVGPVVMLKILPTLVFASALMSVLFHFGILQRVVRVMAWLMERTLRVSGAEALSASANVFLGMTEAPLVIRPYMERLTASELLAVMVGGFATISGSMMAVYSSAPFGVPFDQMLAASIVSAPAGLYLTKLALPERETPATLGSVQLRFDRETVNFIDAAASGAATGLTLALNVGAMLLAFAAGLALIDGALGALGEQWGSAQPLTLGRVLGWVFWPAAVLMGVPPAEAEPVGGLLGTKIAVNEYFAYEALGRTQLGERSRLIASYALCGFANFGSIAIQLGGIGGLVPSRRRELARFGFKAMVLGALASITSATLAGLLL